MKSLYVVVLIHYMYSKEVYELLLPVTKCKSGTKKREIPVKVTPAL